MSSQASYDAYRRREVLRLRRSLNRLQDEALLLRRDIRAGKFRQRKFNPDQPRVPAGNTGGGQWTSGESGGGGGSGFGGGFGGDLGAGFGEEGFGQDMGEDMGESLFVDPTGEASWSSFSQSWSEDGSIFERDIVNRDGSTIQSEYAASREAGFDERQTVRLASGEKVSFETTERVQTIRYGDEVVGRSLWTASGPEPDATVQPVLLGPLRTGVGAAGAILFGWESQRNGLDGRQAVVGFNAYDFYPGESRRFELSQVSRLTYEQVEAACQRLPDVQSLTDRAASAAGPSSQYPSMAVYGTDVHTRFKYFVEELKDPRFRAERSFMKETGDPTSQDDVRYGYPGSIRVDAYEYRRDGTLCIYDLKTGKSGVTRFRADVLANAAKFGFTGIRRIIVTEVRPRR